VTEARDPAAIEILVKAFKESDGEIRAVLGALFNSDFFKEARFRRVKCPAEFIAGVLKLAGGMATPEPALAGLGFAIATMGQNLHDPPSVEGWHTGPEWIDGGTLVERVNFAVSKVRSPHTAGVSAVFKKLEEIGDTVAPAIAVDRCLEVAGPLEASDATRAGLLSLAEEGGPLNLDDESAAITKARLARMLALVVSAPEYQFC
jgi:hypothetical protein